MKRKYPIIYYGLTSIKTCNLNAYKPRINKNVQYRYDMRFKNGQLFRTPTRFLGHRQNIGYKKKD